MYIIATYIEYNEPKTGMSPTIKIYKLSDKSVIVNGAAMEELGDGAYMYNFTGYSPSEDYFPICDGGATLINRYCYPLAIFKDHQLELDFIKDIEGGKWKVENMQMVFYKDDNTTEVARFNLFDSQGIPDDGENTARRERV
jgi:hypothetical protein